MARPKKRILVIDDQEVFLRAILPALRSMGYIVRTVSDCLDGLQILKHQVFDLVIVDMVMPQIGGLAVIKVIRKEHPNTSILAISGYYDKLSDLVNHEDIDGILPKPIGMEMLQSTLDRIFSNKIPLNCRG